MEPRAFLELAYELLQPGASDARVRTAVSRCYYAVFHTLKNDLSDTVRWAGDGSDHENVRRFIQEAVDQPGRDHDRVVRRLKQLHTWRRQADYELGIAMANPELTYPFAVALLNEFAALDRWTPHSSASSHSGPRIPTRALTGSILNCAGRDCPFQYYIGTWPSTQGEEAWEG